LFGPGDEAAWLEARVRSRIATLAVAVANRGEKIGLDSSGAAMIAAVCGDAAAVDVEIASMHEMRDTLALLAERSIPWVASSHHFDRLPEMDLWRELRERARAGGASVAKFAATLHDAEEMAVLESFQSEPAAISVSTMGMGALAPASRVRCALAGSVLNYGYIGQAPTAPGQWPAATLRAAIQEKKIPSP
jgi:3-dehydroquinate dehydratase type I